MGISGLLPALKSIQKTKNLSELSSQTVAVDVYVWLHKAVFTCAPELATGKPTHKYVDYVMHRVRLLRHHKIEPYLVFDGGPLPAKSHTEESRKLKRDQNLAMAKTLEAQGKYSQAREYFAKCVDVSPKMAYQVIKALRAESVPYVVAPYEADAQMAFLERSGIVDAILTEDSDLLVFGCRHVLFKLDTVANTVISIHRNDFGSVTTSVSDSISLVGWSDVQFRSMAILSGCDYLPSIPGIGLKTACALLRKWKTPEQVVRIIAFEGKKTVPKGYLAQYKLAEKCFLHQRVYDPLNECLVHLTDVACDSEWNAEADLYVGRYIEASLAKDIALGTVDPETYERIEDINPGYIPRVVKAPLVSQSNKVNAKGKPENGIKGKGKGKVPASGGILSFFGANPTIPQAGKSALGTQSQRPTVANKPKPSGKRHVHTKPGESSGKRTLTGVMEDDLERKRRKILVEPTSPKSSRFFPTSLAHVPRRMEGSSRSPSPSNISGHTNPQSNKENEFDQEGASMLGNPPSEQDEETFFVEDEVVQEIGYISPCASSRSTPDLSSPIRGGPISQDQDEDVDPVSSPVRSRVHETSDFRSLIHGFMYHPVSGDSSRSSDIFSDSACITNANKVAGHGEVLVASTPTPTPSPSRPGNKSLVDLRNAFGDECCTEVGIPAEVEGNDGRKVTGTSSPSPQTPTTEAAAAASQPAIRKNHELWDDDDELSDPEEQAARLHAQRQAVVANGWKQRFSHRSTLSSHQPTRTPPTISRRETNVTPLGRHSLSGLHSFYGQQRSRDSIPPRSVPPRKTVLK